MAGGLDDDGPAREPTDGYTITSLRSGGKELDRFIYDTLARVALPEPLAPRGGQVELEIEWSFEVPLEGGRMGVFDTENARVFSLAQWFPAVAVYDDVNGWNALPYLGAGEFYTNFGDYDVRLTVPRDHLVAATGVLQNPGEVLTATQRERVAQARSSAETVIVRGADELEEPGTRPAGEGPLTWHFTAEDVRSFAWASSADFIWDAAGLDGVLLQSFYPASALPLWEEGTQMLRASIEHFSRDWYPYPYPVAVNVNGYGDGGGGMEYPMIVFNGRCEDRVELYSLVCHEFGHQWFPMIVNTDERRHTWFDEGLNTFINYYSIIEYLGEAGPWYDLEDFLEAERRPDRQPVFTPSDQISGENFGHLGYDRPGRALILLREKVLGPDRFDAAFREYVRRWAFKSPQPADFIRTLADAAGSDLSWFWNGWFAGTGSLDQAVIGALERDGRLELTFWNLGDVVMPLEYRVDFADGTHEDVHLPVEIWLHRDEFRTGFPLEGRTPVRVVVDPESELPDVDREDNVLDAF